MRHKILILVLIGSVLAVLDRSGSMSIQRRFWRIRGAADQFVSFVANGDSLGVISFSSNIRVDYPLATVDSDADRNAARMTSANTWSCISPSVTMPAPNTPTRWREIFRRSGTTMLARSSPEQFAPDSSQADGNPTGFFIDCGEQSLG